MPRVPGSNPGCQHPISRRRETMVKLEYFNGKEWVFAGGPFYNETMAWVSLGGDDLNYRTVDDDGNVLTEKIRRFTCES